MLPFGQMVPFASPMLLFPGRPRPTSAADISSHGDRIVHLRTYMHVRDPLRRRFGARSRRAPLRSGERRLVLDGIQRRLRHEPTRPTKHVKRLRKLLPPFEHVPPIWQLRIGEYRVFYDVDEVEKVVSVRAVRRKPPHMTTEQIP